MDSLAPTTRGLILVAAGVTLLGVVLPLQLRTRTLLKQGVKVQGTVVDAEEETGWLNNRIYRTYHPVVEFTTTDGRTVTFTSALGSSGRPDRRGSEVPVRYYPDDPEEAEIDYAYLWMVPAAPLLLAGVGLLVAAGVAFTDEPRVAPTAEQAQATPTVVDSPEASVTEEPVAVGRPAKVATGRIGDRLTVVDHSGKAQLEVTVTRLKFFRGDQVVQPQHGWHMGVHVEAQALASGQNLSIVALVDGHMYSDYWGDTWAGFDPLLDPDELQWLSWGERVAGWLVVDVPGRHGELMLHNELNHKVAVWTY